MKKTSILLTALILALAAVVVALVLPAFKLSALALGVGALGLTFQQQSSDIYRQMTAWGLMDANGALKSLIGNSGVFGKVELTLDRQFVIAGIGNAADTTDDTVFTTVLNAGSLAKNGDELMIEANLTSAANGNNKTAKVILGATTLLTTGVLTSNAKKIQLLLRIVRTAAATQLWFASVTVDGVASAVSQGTSAEDLTTKLNLKLTLASPTTGAAADLLAFRWAVDVASLAA